MSYEIPQQLEYNEKVVFGLTFSQLAWAMLFGLPAAGIFIKSNANIYIKSTAVILLCFCAILFMFFNASRFIMDYYAWLKFRKVSKPSSKLEKFIGVKGVKKDLIITDKKKVVVLRVEPFNFAIKGESEKESVLQVFQKFLNSIDFPVQVLMTTDSLEVDSYLKILEKRVEETVKKTKNKLYINLFDKYGEHLKKTVAKKGIMDRNFYLVIPESKNVDIQVEICREKLENLNLKVDRLDNKRIKALLVKCFGGSGECHIPLSLSPRAIKNFADKLRKEKLENLNLKFEVKKVNNKKLGALLIKCFGCVHKSCLYNLAGGATLEVRIFGFSL